MHRIVFIAAVGAALLATARETQDAGMTDADCRNSFWCSEKGRCTASNDSCVATGAADCEASSECQSKGFCAPVDNQCRFRPCVQRELCTKLGYCTDGPDNTCCNDAKMCCDDAGNCKVTVGSP
ncbi:MAG: hypothetical protein H6747_05065 [Deltaproteobacteria bacterium]|nr:hypothetical protein [Deltaproteobacteria bacterium]